MNQNFYPMKKILSFMLLFVALSSFTLVSLPEIISALKSGNALELSKYFDKTVEITLPEKSNSYSKSQASIVLRDFFKNNQVKDFKVIHQSQKEDSEFCIGTLITTKGSFRVTIFTRQSGQQKLIQELRFEK
jgi:hypothetical protein